MRGLLMKPHALSTRDAQLPAAYSDRLESLSLAPLWTALHALLPPERQTRGGAHRRRGSELRARGWWRGAWGGGGAARPPAGGAPPGADRAGRAAGARALQSRPARQLLGDGHALRGPADHPARRGG